MEAPGHNIFGAVFETLKGTVVAGHGDVAKGAFACVHEFAVAPVRTRGEIWPVVFAGVEEEPL